MSYTTRSMRRNIFLEKIMKIWLAFIVPGLWLVLLAIWGVSAICRKKDQQTENIFSRSIHLGLIGLSFVLTLSNWLDFGPLGDSFVPQNVFFILFAFLIEVLGMGLAVWARFHLGSNWSGTVTLKEDHKLIISGPYTLMRHPIYSGWLLALLGTALVYGRWAGLLGLAIMFLADWRKIKIEERFLIAQFGEQYLSYRQKVKALIPFIF